MRISYDSIIAAIRAALGRHGIEAGTVRLMEIEPPRDWGVATNACFGLAPVVAAEEIAFATEGLDKKAAKQEAARITKEVSEKLAAGVFIVASAFMIWRARK